MRRGVKRAEVTFTNSAYAEMFRRFYRERSPSYRGFVSIQALCGALGTDITDRNGGASAEYERMMRFLSEARTLLENDRKRLLRYCMLSVKVWMNEVMPSDADDSEIARDMSLLSRRANFKVMFRKLCMEADVDDQLRREDSGQSQI